MGWMTVPTGFSLTTAEIKDEISKQFRGDDISLKYISLKFGTAYAALENDKTKEVTAYVVLWKYDKNAGELSTKVMNETAGPVKREATMKLLKMLTPIDNDYANEWRFDCWKNFKKMPDKFKQYFEEKGFDLSSL